jgi:cell division initiation protein
MKIGPVDIRNHTFSARKMGGVDESEVRAYLDLVADRLEEVTLDTDELKGTIERLEVQLQEYSQVERALRDSLISAERMADERLATAEKEARIILKNAEVDAEKIVVAARGELARLRAEIDDLRRQKVTYVERFRALLRSQAKILEASIETFDPERGGGEYSDVLSVVDPSAASPPQTVAPYLGEEGLFSAPENRESTPSAGEGD